MSGAVVVAFCAVLLPASSTAASQWSAAAAPRGVTSVSQTVPAAAGARITTRITGFDTRPASVLLSREVKDDVTVLPGTRRVVLVQARAPGSSRFVTQSMGSSTATGRFRAVYRPTSGGDWRFRLVVRPSGNKKAATSATRVVTAIDRTAPQGVTQLALSQVGLDRATLVWVAPSERDFTGVLIRRAVGSRAPSSPTQGTAVTDTSRQQTRFTDTRLTSNTDYSYALFAHDASGNFSRAATITLRTTRVAVTGLVATSVARTTVALSWTNPTDADFAGAVIRREVGPIAPASVTDGTLVSDVAAPDNTLTDNGLAPDTQYTYAVFAYDAADHVAAAATLTLTTRAPGTDAVLTVNPLLGTGTNVTMDTSVAFDASQSLAADGSDLVSWTLDYGDGSPVEQFTGPFGPADVLNTTHTFTNAETSTVTLTVTDSVGGSDTASVTVHVFPAPRVSINTVGSPQAGVPLTFEVHPDTPQGTAVTSYQVVVTGDDNFFIDGDGAPPATFDLTLAAGTYTVLVTLTNDAGGAAVSDPVDVVVP